MTYVSLEESKSDNSPSTNPFLESNYILSKSSIGRGSYSEIFECRNKYTHRVYAAKKYRKKLMQGLEKMLQNEFLVLRLVSMTHPNILSLIDYFETKDSFYLVTDLAKGSDLFQRLDHCPGFKLPEEDTMEITAGLVSAVSYLHEHNIVHRDVKAENLLFTDTQSNSAILADFGLATIVQPLERLYKVCGTLSYMAPEIFEGTGYSFPVDVWAIGVTVYFMLCGYMPFDCESDDETKDAIKHRKYLFEPAGYWESISTEAKDFIDRCLTLDPELRVTTSELMSHPFIIGNRPINNFKGPRHSSSRSLSSISLSSTVSNYVTNAPQAIQSIFGEPSAYSSFLDSESDVDNESQIGIILGRRLCETPLVVSKFATPCISRAGSINSVNDDNDANRDTCSFFLV